MGDAEYWIRELGLRSHPEGGFFRETYRSSGDIAREALPPGFAGPRPFGTAIYFLIDGGGFSALHRLRSDELWHHYAGSSLTLHLIDPHGALTELRLGPDRTRGDEFQRTVPAGSWFGATVDDPLGYSLVGCTLAPGFSFDDFELGDCAALIAAFPQHADLIRRLTQEQPV